MIIVKRYVKKNGRRVAVYLVFATNMPARKARRAMSKDPLRVQKALGHRDGVRTANKSRACTKSNSLSARLFLFYFSMVVQNVWAMVNFEADTQRTKSGLLEGPDTGQAAGRRAGARPRPETKAVVAVLAERRHPRRHGRPATHDRRQDVSPANEGRAGFLVQMSAAVAAA